MQHLAVQLLPFQRIQLLATLPSWNNFWRRILTLLLTWWLVAAILEEPHLPLYKSTSIQPASFPYSSWPTFSICHFVPNLSTAIQIGKQGRTLSCLKDLISQELNRLQHFIFIGLHCCPLSKQPSKSNLTTWLFLILSVFLI